MLALADVHLTGSPGGFALALAAGAFWAAYIVLGHRVAADAELRPQDGLALAMSIGAVALAPFLVSSAVPALVDPLLLAACLAVGVASSVVPYGLEQVAMRRLARARFALLLALLPATAAVVGAIVLGQVPGLLESAGIALVVVAASLRTPRGRVTSRTQRGEMHNFSPCLTVTVRRISDMEAGALRAPAARNRISVTAPLLRLRSDEQLVALFRAGNDAAFSVIHDRYRQRLFVYSRQMLGGSRQDAEDALQDVFLRAYSSLRVSDNPVSLRAWLYRVAHNRCIDHLRKPIPPAIDLFETSRRPLHDPTIEAERREDLRRLIEDVRRLPEQQRSALLMREMDGLSYAELAEALGVSLQAVKSLLVRARIGLVEAIEARDTACVEIRSDLADSFDRGVRASGRTRKHLRDCSACTEYRSQLRGVRDGLGALSPGPGPLAAALKLLGHRRRRRRRRGLERSGRGRWRDRRRRRRDGGQGDGGRLLRGARRRRRGRGDAQDHRAVARRRRRQRRSGLAERARPTRQRAIPAHRTGYAARQRRRPRPAPRAAALARAKRDGAARLTPLTSDIARNTTSPTRAREAAPATTAGRSRRRGHRRLGRARRGGRLRPRRRRADAAHRDARRRLARPA